MKARQEHLDGRAAAILLACCLFWGVQQVLVKATLPELAPVFQAALRFAGATALLWLWCLWRGVPLWRRDGTLRPGLLAGTLFAAEFAAMYLGLQLTTASRLTVFLYTSPFWVALLVPLFVPAERLRRVQWAGLACAFVGVAVALREGFAPDGAGVTWRGDLLGLAAGALWGLTTVTIRASRLARASPEKMLFYQVAVSAATLPLLSAALGEPWHWQWSAFASTSIVVQTVIGAFVSYLVWMWLLAHYPATRISVFVFLTPIFALIAGALWLGEAVTVTLLLALALVAAGIVLVNKRAAAPMQEK
ncbi:DMT family transporter [Ottowia testudinis]|uniref:DMT family transporter n=1 Tax=Ottowia testudinis TaxID=2816950 RepID=A0A975CIP2_9BURK|nr:DMT family transporter [Ottowia testudinis]QTD45682.1 DMT family transporter [Ottowia testudinis]